MTQQDPWNPEDLDLPERDAEELAALLAFAANERRPPAALKERVLARLKVGKPAPSSFQIPIVRWVAAAAAAAVAVMLLALYVWSPQAPAMLSEVRGEVLVDGRPARAGTALKPGQVVAAQEKAEAVIAFGSRAAVRLLHGGTVSFSAGAAVKVSLRRGWMLSAVVSGTSYSVVTEHGRVSALGTDFLTKAQGQDTYICICHGRLGITGGFGRLEVASENHAGWVFTGSRTPYQPDYGTMEGHTDEDIASLRAFVTSSSLPGSRSQR